LNPAAAEYWPWWAGALALGSVTFAFAVLVHRPMGVSGSWDRVAHWRRERRRERSDAQWGDERALAAALAAATADAFVDAEVDSARPGGSLPAPATLPLTMRDEVFAPYDPPVPRPRRPEGLRRPIPLVCEAAFILAMFVGGLAAALTSGRFRVVADMGPAFSRIVTDNPWLMTASLFGGGILVGFGTRLAGGCSSGHGLSGCSRLHPGSLVATAVFFAAAAAMSTLLWQVI
jgi:hypothetical protein